MKSRNLFLILLIALGALTGLVSAAVIEVAAGTDVLAPAISGASAGDVIELTTDGGIYLTTALLDIDKNLTIRGKASLAVRPVIKYTGTSTSGYFFKILNSPKVLIQNLNLDGDGRADGAVALVKNGILLNSPDTSGTIRLQVDNCLIHDVAEKGLRAVSSSGTDSLVITNCIIYNAGSEGITLYNGSTSDSVAAVRNTLIKNTTFHSIEREALKAQVYPYGKVRLERCTFFDIGRVEKKQVIYFSNMTDVEMKNCIIAKNHNADLAEQFAQFTSAASTFHHNVVWDVYNWAVKNATVSDTVHADPQFVDTLARDFTIQNPLLLTYADDGGPVGDQRWVPAPVGPTVWPVAEGANVLSAAIAAAEDGDVIELTTSGGVYTESGALSSISKSLTIRAAEGLAIKPIIRVNTTDYVLKLTGVDARYVFKGLEIDGTNGTATSVNKYFLRIDNLTPTGTMEVIVDDCYIHNCVDKFIKPYGNTGMDSLVIRNCVFRSGGSEGIVFYSGSSTDPAAVIAYGEVSNTTMDNIVRECIKGDTYAGGKIVIDHLTAYSCGSTTKGMIYFDDWLDVTVKNSIFVKNTFATNFGRFESDANIVKNCVIWDVASWNTENTTSVTDTLHVDPQFADPATGDFTLGNLALLTHADDGGPVGDLRWVPTGKKSLTINVVGSGTVALNPPGGLYDEGTVVTMTATPAEYWAFDGWSENVFVFPPKNPVAQVTVSQNMLVTAYFIPTIARRTVDIETSGLGHVAVVEHPKIVADGYFDGDTLILTAVADTSSWEFAYWVNAGGDSLTAVNPLTWVVDADTVFRAKFRSLLPQFTLNLILDGQGRVLVDPLPLPGLTTYDQGTVVTLTAEAAIGWDFVNWTGDLTGTELVKQVTMTTDVTATAHFGEKPVPNGELLVDNTWDLRTALKFAKNNSQVKVIKLIESGPFAPLEADRVEGRLPELNIDFPVTIVGAETLAVKPVIKGWGEGGSEGLFRLRENGHLVLWNLEIDGYSAPGKVTKYIYRLDDGKAIRNSIEAYFVDFHGAAEVFLKFYALAHADTIRFQHCTVWDIGKEGIFDNTTGTSDYVELRNCTFHHIGREVGRFKVQNPRTVIDHVTVDNCGYGFGTEGSKFGAFKFEIPNDVKIVNTIVSNVLNTSFGYSIRFYGDKSLIDNTLLFNAPRIDDNDGSVIGADVYWWDPLFVDPTLADFTLKDSSFAYHLAGDTSKAIGDLRWATSSNVAIYHTLQVTSSAHGQILTTPPPMTKFYLPGTVVTLTADADTLYKFGSWSGDVTGSVSPTSLTVDANKQVHADFIKAFYSVELNVNMSVWAQAGKFVVGQDSVDVAGTFNAWGGHTWLKDLDGDTIYTTIVAIDENYPQFEWKFRINGSWNDATCEFPYGGANRVFTAHQDTSLTFWYNNDLPQVGIIAELIPERYELRQNYPNPFNPTTTIKFGLKQDGYTTLIIYNLLGKEVARLVDREMPAGYHEVIFADGTLPSGVYIFKLTSGNFSAIKKMMLMK